MPKRKKKCGFFCRAGRGIRSIGGAALGGVASVIPGGGAVVAGIRGIRAITGGGAAPVSPPPTSLEGVITDLLGTGRQLTPTGGAAVAGALGGLVGGPAGAVAGVGGFNTIANAFCSRFPSVSACQSRGGMSALGPQTVTSSPVVAGSSMLNLSDIMPVGTKMVADAPKGFRVHTVNEGTAPLLGMPMGSKVAVRLGSAAAKALGVRRERKPPISVGEASAMRRRAAFDRKIKRLSKQAGLRVPVRKRT